MTHLLSQPYVESIFDLQPPANKGGACFKIGIHPRDFEKLAKEMMTTNPEAAVKAFGAALQDVPKIPNTLRG
jgi:hypothetical protein